MMETVIPAWMHIDARAFRTRVLEKMEGLSERALAEMAVTLNRRQEKHLVEHCINLYPGTNIMSPIVTDLLGSSVASRASEGHPGSKYQTGLQWVEEAEVMASELIRRVFGATYAEVRALSGSMANMAVLNGLTEPGDPIFSLTTAAGAHISHGKAGAAGYRRLEIHPIPYDPQEWRIDLDKLRDEVRAVKPRMIILGASLILFSYPVEAIRALADEVGAILMYDAAHVAGMIAGGQWQNPLKEGAHVMTASTYKSFGGPPGGIVLTNDAEIARKADHAVFPGMTANFHTNRMAPLAVAAAEMMAFGEVYAQQCAENAQALASAFVRSGLTPAGRARGYSAGHMLALDVRENGGGKHAATALEDAHLICNMNLLPWDTLKDLRDPSGLRLAVHEVTRWGMGTAEMERIADLFHRVLVEGESAEDVRPDVLALKSQHSTLHYCYEKPDPIESFEKFLPEI